MASIARKNLFEDIPRFLVAQAGIMFAVSLVTIQVGILRGFTRSTTLLIENSTADIWVASEDMVHLELTSPISVEDVIQARQIEGVARAEPLLLTAGRWLFPDGELTQVRIFGFDLGGTLFLSNQLDRDQIDALKQPYTALADTTQLDSLDIVGE
ncbi:MAG: ABC transporter permease, partial [Cyanothece sp. SIO1E1]|nr:ABC transporter permease [Cyanothece sp. SIO1E1]